MKSFFTTVFFYGVLLIVLCAAFILSFLNVDMSEEEEMYYD